MREGGREGKRQERKEGREEENWREVSKRIDTPLCYLDEAERDKILYERGLNRAVKGSERNGGHTLQSTTEHSEGADVGPRGT